MRFYHCVPASPIISKIVRFFHSFVDSCIWTICHHKDFTGRVLLWENFISARNNLFHTQRRFFLAKYRSPNEPHLLRMVQPIRSPGNPGTTVVSIGHLTPWPENPGYRTQVWDNIYIYIYILGVITCMHNKYIFYIFIRQATLTRNIATMREMSRCMIKCVRCRSVAPCLAGPSAAFIWFCQMVIFLSSLPVNLMLRNARKRMYMFLETKSARKGLIGNTMAYEVHTTEMMAIFDIFYVFMVSFGNTLQSILVIGSSEQFPTCTWLNCMGNTCYQMTAYP